MVQLLCAHFQGIRNSILLRTYCDIDERFRKLGFFIKRWASHCRINDASCGTLSSYALINMLVFYLQRTTPPVLPFLQQVDTFYIDLIKRWRLKQLQKKRYLRTNGTLIFLKIMSLLVNRFAFTQSLCGLTIRWANEIPCAQQVS